MSLGCLNDDGRIGVHRGLCHNCYNAILKRIKQGKTTWDKEVAAGRALAAGKGNLRWIYPKKTGGTGK